MADEFNIRITYNGIIKELEVQPHEQVQAVLEHAIHLFSLQRQPHQMGLFTEQNVQVAGRTPQGTDIQQSVEGANLGPNELLVLKQVVIEGGG